MWLRVFDPAEHSGEVAGWIDPKQRTGAGRSEEGAEFVVCANLAELMYNIARGRVGPTTLATADIRDRHNHTAVVGGPVYCIADVLAATVTLLREIRSLSGP